MPSEIVPSMRQSLAAGFESGRPSLLGNVESTSLSG